MKIGGNIDAVIQAHSEAGTNEIGENASIWADTLALRGWLDMQTGESTFRNFNAKIQESTHIFVCDYEPFLYDGKPITPENSRMVIDGQVYDVMLYDDPMSMHQQMEVYLRYTGGQYD